MNTTIPKNPGPRYRHLTILHSNDLHGDFLAENLDDKLVGGVSMLSGYINKVRREIPNTLYMIAGDMFCGSLIDSEYQGISTIDIMNALGPDIVTIGNHEMDYGLAHLLFLERCSKFPIVNANIYIKNFGTRLFQSHQILEIEGMKILVIGILTKEVLDCAKKDNLLDTCIEVSDAASEVGIICDSYKNTDIDFTILLTHIGFENDKKLAETLNPEWGVDIIIGGHSHTILEQPEQVNDILIVQAGIGTDQIGHFDIEVDTDTNSIHSYQWKTVSINEENCERNEAVEQLILNYKEITDAKYGVILTTLTGKATHPNRYQETSVGNLFCDILKENYGLDLVLMGSGGLRSEQLGPVVTKGSLLEMYAYDEKMLSILLTGAEIKRGMKQMFDEASNVKEGGHSEYYQISDGFRFTYNTKSHTLTEATLSGHPIPDNAIYRVGIEGFHADNMDKFLSLDPETIKERGEWKIITNNIRTSLEEYMKTHTHLCPALFDRTKRI